MMTLETERLILRPQTLADFDVWLPLYADPEIFRLDNAPGFTPEEGWNRLLRNIGHWSAFGYGIFSLFRKSDGQFVGETGIANFHRSINDAFDNRPEASWVISRAVQGQGIATEAAREVHRWFYDAFRPAQTVCLISAINAASLKVAQNVGYSINGECQYKGVRCLTLLRERAIT